MTALILEIVLFFGIGTIIYLLARALPRIGDDAAEEAASIHWFDRLLARIPMEKLDEASGRILEKTLRRIRLSVLRFDNFLGKSLDKIRRSNGSPAASLRAGGNGNGKATLFAAKEDKAEKEEFLVGASKSGEEQD